MSRRWLFAPLGVLIALPLVEAAFWMRDDGAFPHLNLYLADAELGVRVQPSSEMRLQLATNPVTTVRTNSRGTRGGEWPEPGAEEILVVGDSQVFGLGVEDDEVFAQGLAEATGRTVLNGGVPTYGPAEYQAVVEEVLAERPVTTVVVVVNFVNDLFELERPNVERHAVWDGWAVRLETAPESVVGFPGRAWLMGRSHAVYALRGLLRGDGRIGELPSEGTWEDLLGSGLEVAALHQEEEQRLVVEKATHGQDLQGNENERRQVQDRIDDDLRQEVSGYGDDVILGVAQGDPGDIVDVLVGVESSRDVAITADHIRRAARLRRDWERQLRSREDLVVREGLVRERDALRRQAPARSPVPTVLGPWIEELGAVCTAGGAELVVVALPMDVQVSSREWAKYDQPEQDLSGSLILLEDLVDHAHRLQMRALDATQALRGVGEGAFLDADIHMTPASHAALAEALAETLSSPPPVKRPLPGIPQERSPVPEPRDWLEAQEIVVRGSSKAGCWTLQIQEWLRITCRDAPGNHPTGIDVDHPEARVVVTEYAATLVVPLTRDLTADFHWDKRTQTLHVEGGKRWFSKPSGEGRALTVSKVDEDLCKCHISVNRERECEDTWSLEELAEGLGYEDEDAGPTCEVSCETLYGTARDCDYLDCDLRLACAQGDLLAPPACEEGEWNVLGLCQPLCDDEHPCEQGECTPWMGSGVCI